MTKATVYQAKGSSLQEQYFDVGKVFAKEIQTSVKKIVQSRTKLSLLRKQVAAKSLVHFASLPVTQEFMECLKSWSKGAGISLTEAMYLLADNLVGCQTLMMRYGSGIALLHTEEDFENIQNRMTNPQIISFRTELGPLECLVYNDLLPGAGVFGWSKNLIIAVDSLFTVNEGIEQIEKPSLANVVAWMAWRKGAEGFDQDKFIKLMRGMGTVVDGYALNIVTKLDAKLLGSKITFTRDEIEVEKLGESLGDYLRQVNIIDPKYARDNKPIIEWRVPPKRMSQGYWRYFVNRLAALDRNASFYRKYAHQILEKEKIYSIHEIINQEIFTKLANDYINNDVGAVAIGLLDQSCTSVSVKLNDGQVQGKSCIITYD